MACLAQILCLWMMFVGSAQQPPVPPVIASPHANELWVRMENEIRGVADRLNGVLGVSVRDLTSGREFCLNGDKVFPAASTIKLAVLAELYHQAFLAESGASGKLKITDLYTVRQADRVPDSAIFNNLAPGATVLTCGDLAALMIVVSDNAAANVLIQRLGMDAINKYLAELGLAEIRLRRKMMDLEAARRGDENVATPRQLVELLARIGHGQLLGERYTADFFRLLRTPKESDLPRRIPAAVPVANKPGSLPGVRCDAGIVEVPGRPFAIAVMTAFLAKDADGGKAIARVAVIAYRYFERLGAASPHGRYLEDRASRN